MENSFKKFIAALWTFFFVISLLAVPAAAEEAGTIHISAKYGNQPVVGLELKAYLCAELRETGFVLVGDFKDYPLASMPRNADTWNELAVGFEGFVSANGIIPDAALTADDNGIIEFAALEPGLYFFPGAVLREESDVYTSSPFFLYFSASEPAVEAKLKLSCEPAADSVVRKVLKVWNDQGDAESRPDRITVILYADGTEYESVELTKETNWSYSWFLPEGHNWSISECTPEGYVSEIHMEGITFTITNTPCKPPPTPLSSPVLPQTGLIWWPILVFWGLGIVAFVLALRFRRLEKDEKK